MAMNCAELEQEWEQRFTDSLVAGESFAPEPRAWSVEAEAHLATCAGCRQRLRSEALLDQAILAWRGQDLPPVNVPSAQGWLQKPQYEAVRSRSPSLWSPSFVVAASCLVCVATGWLLLRPVSEVPLQVNAPVTSEDPAVTDSLALMLSDVRTHSEAAARSTVSSLDRWPVSVAVAASPRPLVAPSIPVRRSDEESPPHPPQNWSRWGSPLGQQVGGAFQFLNEVLPEMAGPAG